MTYFEFNKKTFEFYVKRAKSSFFTLSIDQIEFESITDLQEVSKFGELRKSWYPLLKSVDAIPQYFGLLAIQCYAASIMHDDGANASDAYQIRLRDLLKISDNNQLQILFSGSNSMLPPQEEIWTSAKSYLKQKFHFDLEIPSKTKYAGRYVQYPKSQALLTTEDLRCFTPFFSEEFRVDESLTLDFFEKRIYACLPNIQITNRVKSLFSDTNKRERCIKQVFNFYNNWNGEIYFKSQKIKNRKSKERAVVSNEARKELILVLSNKVPKFYFLDPTLNNSLKEVFVDDLFRSKSFSPFYSDLILFTQSEYYLSEYEESRFLSTARPSYILVNKTKRFAEFLFLEKRYQNRIEISESYFLYELNLSDDITLGFLSKYIQTESTIKLVGGIRTGRKREYLVGFGPAIISDTEFAVIYNFEKYDYDRETAIAGIYKIREDNIRDIEFLLINPLELIDIIPPKNIGWIFSSYSFGNNPDIEGCLVLKTISTQRPNSIRDWINVNVGEKYHGENILLQVINNSKS